MLNMIQRGTIARPLNHFRLGVSVQLDYMGSSEFEGGPSRRSLIAMYLEREKLVRERIEDIIDDKDRSLRLFGLFGAVNLQTYRGWLLDHLEGRRQTLDPSYLHNKVKTAAGRPLAKPRLRYEERTDLWWDLDHHVIMTFDKAFASRLPDLVRASWDFMALDKVAP